MTVKELINSLSKVPNQDARVVVDGYEGGLSDVEQVLTLKIALGVHSSGYEGPHEPMDGDVPADSHPVDAVHIEPASNHIADQIALQSRS